jgi:hypothetical protein
MSNSRLNIVKCLVLSIAAVAMVMAGTAFRAHRQFIEPVVASPGVTAVKKLSNYHPSLEGSVADCNVYIFDSGKKGGTVMLVGGSHPEEPASNLTAQVFVENAMVKTGKLVVIIRASRSASTVTRPGDAYPQFYTIPTPWGEKTYRMGDRWTNPLDSWPDPEVYAHYPSGQNLAYMDIRNLNRTWPGKPDGLLTEQVTYAITQVVKTEGVDLFIDYHEAELEYPIINTIVAHEKAQDIAAMASMMLTSGEFKSPIGMEYSPPSLHGLSHREIGDHTNAASLLFETPEPFLDRVRGETNEKLLLEGKDQFVMQAGKKGLLYEAITEEGWPIKVRVGRHCSTTLEVCSIFSDMNPDKLIEIDGVPRYAQLLEKGVGYFFHSPEASAPSSIYYE